MSRNFTMNAACNRNPTPRREEREMSIIRHIRKRGHGRDRRTRAGRYANAPSPTLCGADPTIDDGDRRDMLHILTWPVKPKFFAEYCPACVAVVARLREEALR